MAGVTVVIGPQGGLEIDVTTDALGKFAKPGLPAGLYTITFKQDDKTLFKIRANVAAGKDTAANISMSEQRVKDFPNEMKKQLEAEAQFGKFKTHFNARNAAIEEEKAAKAYLLKAGPADRGEPQSKLEMAASK